MWLPVQMYRSDLRKGSSCHVPSKNDAVRNLFWGLFVCFFLFFKITPFTNVSTCLFVQKLCSLLTLWL